MMLKTGTEGFTLVEIMVATAILALGLVFVYQAFFVSVDAYDYYSAYLSLAPWLDSKAWEAQNNLSKFASLQDMSTSGVLVNAGRRFNWSLASNQIDEVKDKFKLFKFELMLSWKQGRRSISISRSSYALYKKQ